MKISRILAAVFFLLLLTSLPTALAGESTTTHDLEEMVVQEKRDRVDTAASVWKISAEKIHESGARDIVEAMMLLPGIDIVTGGKGIARMNIRGFRTRHVLLLLNGIPVNSAYDNQFDASLIPVEHIEKIEMVLGPNSVMYGQGGAGGVINVITKKGFNELHGMAGAETGTGSYQLKKASISGGGEKIDFFLSGSSYDRDAYPLSGDFDPTFEEDGGGRENSHKERDYLFGNIGYQATDDFSLEMNFSYVEGRYGIPGGVIKVNDDFAPNPKYERIEHLEGYSFQVSADYRMNDTFSLRSWAYINHNEELDCRYDSANFNTSNEDSDDSWQYQFTKKTTIKGVSMQPKINLGSRGILMFGGMAEKDQWGNSGLEKGGYLLVWPPQKEILYADEKKEIDLYSLSAEYRVSPIPKLGVTLGYARHYQDKEEGDDQAESFLFGLNYSLLKQLQLKAAYQKNIRFPSLRQLYDNEAGNENLKTETVHHYTAGLEATLFRGIDIRLDAFRSTAYHFIEKDKFDGIFLNFDKYRFQGGEISTEIRTIPKAVLGASYSYLYTEDLTDSGKEELQYRPAHRITFQCKYKFDFGLSPSFSVLHVAEQYYYAKRGDVTRKKKLDDYTLVNFRLKQTFWDNRLDLYVGADNLLDENYEQSYGLPQAGRIIYAGTEIRF